jgi:hypothetical protein
MQSDTVQATIGRSEQNHETSEPLWQPPAQPPAKKNWIRSFWTWTNHSWKRRILVGVGAVVVIGVFANASGHGSTDFATRYCNATYGQLIANGGAPLGSRADYMSQCHANIASGTVSMDPTIVYDLNNHQPVGPND